MTLKKLFFDYRGNNKIYYYFYIFYIIKFYIHNIINICIMDSFKNFVDLKFFDEIGLEFLILSKNS